MVLLMELPHLWTSFSRPNYKPCYNNCGIDYIITHDLNFFSDLVSSQATSKPSPFHHDFDRDLTEMKQQLIYFPIT